MPAHPDILDASEPLGKSLAGSMVLHVSVAAAVVVFQIVGHRETSRFGDLAGGGPGSVSVGLVRQVPLPGRTGNVNPVANDTESVVPEPLPKTRRQQKVEAPDPTAIAIKSRNAAKRPAAAAAAPNRFREQQKELPNQVYSAAGQAAVSPMYGLSGGGGIGIGNSTPFGTRFGWYAELLRNQVARNWKTADVDPRLRTAPPVVVVFTIRKDGSVPASSVRVVQRSGNAALDYSAQRAVFDSSPFPVLPAGFDRNDATIEFWFELRR